MGTSDSKKGRHVRGHSQPPCRAPAISSCSLLRRIPIPGAGAAPASRPVMTAASCCSRCCYLRFCDGILPLQVLHHSFQLPVLVFRSCQPCFHLRDDALLRSDGGLLRCQGCLELRHHLRKLCGCGGAGRSCAGSSLHRSSMLHLTRATGALAKMTTHTVAHASRAAAICVHGHDRCRVARRASTLRLIPLSVNKAIGTI